jgi:hypothetical protein
VYLSLCNDVVVETLIITKIAGKFHAFYGDRFHYRVYNSLSAELNPQFHAIFL